MKTSPDVARFDERAKRAVAFRIVTKILERRLTQKEAGAIAQQQASQISLIHSGKLRGFTLSRLLYIAARLGENVHLTLAPHTRGRLNRPGKIHVHEID